MATARELAVRVARGFDLPSGTTTDEQRSVEKILEANPDLLRASQGFAPTGLTAARREGFIARERELVGIDPRGRERLEALEQLSTPRDTGRTQGIVVIDPTTGRRTLTSEEGARRLQGEANILERFQQGERNLTGSERQTIRFNLNRPNSILTTGRSSKDIAADLKIVNATIADIKEINKQNEANLTSSDKFSLRNLNKQVSNVSTEPIFEFFQKKTGVDLTDTSTVGQSKLRNFIDRQRGRDDLIGAITRFLEPFSGEEIRRNFGQSGPIPEFERGVGELFSKALRDEPVTFLASFGIALGASKIGTPILTALSKTKVGNVVAQGISKGLPILFFGSKGIEIIGADSSKEAGGIVGRSLAVEVLPFIAGASIGRVNFGIVEKLNKFSTGLDQRVPLAQAKRGRAGTQKTTQVQKEKVVRKKKVDKKKLKELLKKASNDDIKTWRRQQREKIDKDFSLTEQGKTLRKNVVDALIIESKSGVSIITESGRIDSKQANFALNKLQSEFIKRTPQAKLDKIAKPQVVDKPSEVAPTNKNQKIVDRERARNNARIQQAQKPLGQRLSESGQVGRTFGVASAFAGTGQFERSEAVGNRLAQEVQLINSELRQSGLSQGQLLNLNLRINNLQKNLLRNKNNQLLESGRASISLDRQLSINKSKQESLIRQISVTSNKQKTDQLTRQLEATKTLQRTLTQQKTKLKTRQVSLTKQISKLKTKRKLRVGFRRPKKLPKTRPFIPLLKKKPQKKRKGISPVVTRKKNFQVFVRRRGKDVLFKSFGTKPKARKGIRRVLSQSLRASGFIFDKKLGAKVKPIITNPNIYRLGKNDPLRLVERRNKRITKNTREVSDIQQARRLKKAFKSDSSSMSKKLKKRKKS